MTGYAVISATFAAHVHREFSGGANGRKDETLNQRCNFI